MPIYRVTIHHEGAGSPTDVPRGAPGGYTYWRGVNGWTRLRSPYDSFATLHFNHVSVDVCLSGDRDNFPVTDADLAALHDIGADARARGELVANPVVMPHRWSGFQTDCPGGDTMVPNTWAKIPPLFQGWSGAPGGNAPVPQPNHRTLVPGEWGSDVSTLQHRLDVGTGAKLGVDGMYGPATLNVVHGFQAFFKLTVDGVVGPKTWAMVDFCYARKGGK